jgi:hypothetical protein
MGYPKMEKEPKGATASDRTGEKMVRVPKEDKEMYKTGMTGERVPKGALSSDTSGEIKRPIMGGVGMGKADGIGSREASHMGHHDGKLGEMNTGSREHVVYEHKRYDHDQDGM